MRGQDREDPRTGLLSHNQDSPNCSWVLMGHMEQETGDYHVQSPWGH